MRWLTLLIRQPPSREYGDYKLAEQITCLLVKRKAGKKQRPLSQKERLVKSSSLEFSCLETSIYWFNLNVDNPPVKYGKQVI
jgi:hypothetical protein